MAQGIKAKVQASYSDGRRELQRRFDADTHALNATGWAAANSSEVKRVEVVVEHASHKLKNVDHAEHHALRFALRSMEKAGLSKARWLWKAVKDAVRRAYSSGMAAACARRKAGVHAEVSGYS